MVMGRKGTWSGTMRERLKVGEKVGDPESAIGGNGGTEWHKAVPLEISSQGPVKSGEPGATSATR